MRNRPVLISTGGQSKLYMFPDFTIAGQCTAKTKKGLRCGNVAWDQGQVAGYDRTVYVQDRMILPYGPLTGDVARRYLDQRCRVHDTPDAQADCDPEWEPFNLERHGEFTQTPTMGAIVGHYADIPPVKAIAVALIGHFSQAERDLLAELLTTPDSAGKE